MPRIRDLFFAASVAALLLTAPIFPTDVRAQSPPVQFAWPLAWPLGHPRLRVANYFDHDPSPQVLDYAGGTLSYNGHLGTDLNLNSFRDMDEGVPVLAAADGFVLYTQDDNYDRETSAPSVPWNVVVIGHADGTITFYGHLRTHSVTVLPGENVREGQMIGFVGSSGMTLMPHLHFEVHTAAGAPVDPFSGPGNPIPSMWKHQEGYTGFDHLRVHDLGVTTTSAYLDQGGTSDWTAFKYRPSQPAVFGADEPILMVWVLVEGQLGDPYTIEVHRPDGSLYASQSLGVPARNYGQTWQSLGRSFAGNVSPADYGEWNAQVISNGAIVTTNRFTVGETSIYAPRFHWVGGRSFHLSSERQEDILSLSYLGAPMEDLTFTLENAPSNVSLTKNDVGETVVVIDPAGPDLAYTRSREFSVVATDPLGLQDRMHYHLVNYAASALGPLPVIAIPEVVSATEGDTVGVDVSVSDPDGGSIATLTADLSHLPIGNTATFNPGPGNISGKLSWPTAAGNRGTYSVTFSAQTSLGAAASATTAIFVAPAIVVSGPQRTYFPVNDTGANEIGIQGSDAPGRECSPPFGITGGLYGAEWVGDDAGDFNVYTLLSFDTAPWIRGSSFSLHVQERFRVGTPFASLGDGVMIEYLRSNNPLPSRFVNPAEVQGTFSFFAQLPEAGLFATGGDDLTNLINAILATPGPRYLYLRFRFPTCTDRDRLNDQIVFFSGGPGGEARATRIVETLAPAKVALDLDPNVINLTSHAPWVIAYIEPSGFDPASIDISTVRLAGSVPTGSRSAIIGDHNTNGIPDLMLKFPRAALDPLLTPRVNSLEVTGSVVTGGTFAGTDDVRVIDSGGGHHDAAVAPNPLNPSGVLAFHTGKPGRVSVTMFDLQGRLVRTLMEMPLVPAGEHAVRIDGRGERGEELPSGVYFYRVSSPDGSVTGRFAILK